MRRILTILIILSLVGGGLWYFKYRSIEKTGEQPTGVFKSFFPIGGENSSNTDSNNQVPSTTPPDTTPSQTSSFKQLTSRPVAGFSVFSKKETISIPATDPKDKSTLQTVINNYIRYVARQSGFVYEIKNNEDAVQVSNIFIPAIYEAFFVDNSQSVILRFLKEDTQTIGSYTVPIPNENPDGTRTQKEGIFLSDNIKSLAVSPDTQSIATLTTEQGQGTVTTSSSVGKNKKELIRSPINEWLLSWPQKSSVYVQTKSAGTVEGYLYNIDQGSRRFKRVLGNVFGLTSSISPSGNFVLYSESSNKSFNTKILNTKTGEVKSMGLSILPEKCAWLKNDDLICAGNTAVEAGVYPDAWYAGLVSFSDQLYRIYTANNIFDVIYKNDEKSFDMTNLQFDEDRNILFFIDKKTGLLWQFSL